MQIGYSFQWFKCLWSELFLLYFDFLPIQKLWEPKSLVETDDETVETGQIGEADVYESHNSLKLSWTKIWSLCYFEVYVANFVHPGSFVKSKSPDSIAFCETNLEDSVESKNLYLRVCLPLVWKDLVTDM